MVVDWDANRNSNKPTNKIIYNKLSDLIDKGKIRSFKGMMCVPQDQLE